MRHFTPEAPAEAGDLEDGQTFRARCSHSQTRFWLLDQLRPGDPSLHIAARWRIAGRLDADLLAQSFRLLLARHEALRTAIVAEGGRPVQRVHATVPLPFSEIDLSSLLGDRLAEARQIAESEESRPFDLETAPLLRVTLLRLGRSDSLLLVTAHHSVCDGWSMTVLAREFAEIYTARTHGEAPGLSPLPLQYADVAEWEGSSDAEAAARRDLLFWTDALRGMAPFGLPPDHVHKAGQQRRFAVKARDLPEALGTRMGTLGRRQGATFFAVACTVLLCVLAARTGRSDVAVGTQVLGRDETDLEGIVGTFVNTLVLRLDIAEGQSFAQRVDATQRAIREACDHAFAPFDAVVKAVAPARDGLRPPLATVNLRLRQGPEAAPPGGPIRLVDLDYGATGTFFELDFELAQTQSGWRLICEYDAALYEAGTIVALLDAFAETARIAGEGGEPAGTAPAGTDPIASDTLRQVVREAWSEMLGRSDFGDDDEFFAAGGHSLLAARVVARIEARTRLRLSLWSFFEAGTVRRLCDVLRGMTTADLRCRWLQGGGDKPGFTAIHHAAADHELFRPLAAALGSEHPFATLQLKSREGAQESTLEELAGAYREAIVRARPDGPFRLVGFCNSGVLAFEIARQLVEDGREVELVVLIDSWEPGYFRRLPFFARLRARATYRRGRVAALGRRLGRDGLGYLVSRARLWVGASRWWRGLLLSLHRWGLASANPAEEFWQTTDTLDALVVGYDPRPYAGPVLIIRSESIPTGAALDPMLGWRPYLARGVAVAVQGFGHEGAFSPAGSRTMATRIDAVLDERSPR